MDSQKSYKFPSIFLTILLSCSLVLTVLQQTTFAETNIDQVNVIEENLKKDEKEDTEFNNLFASNLQVNP